jgi:hypothetical protein
MRGVRIEFNSPERGVRGDDASFPQGEVSLLYYLQVEQMGVSKG